MKRFMTNLKDHEGDLNFLSTQQNKQKSGVVGFSNLPNYTSNLHQFEEKLKRWESILLIKNTISCLLVLIGVQVFMQKKKLK